jgi:hypothetical protein
MIPGRQIRKTKHEIRNKSQARNRNVSNVVVQPVFYGNRRATSNSEQKTPMKSRAKALRRKETKPCALAPLCEISPPRDVRLIFHGEAGAIMNGMDAKAFRGRWYVPRPAWLVYGAAVATGVLAASDRWPWFSIDGREGWSVLLAMALVAAVFLVTLVWTLAAAVFQRRVQFGLRTLLVFVTVCAVVCSWLAVRIKQARRQAEAIAAIEKKHVLHFGYAFQVDNGEIWRNNAIVPALEPLRRLLGVDFFGDVEYVSIDSPLLTDAELANFAAFTGLERLHISFTNINDAGLSHLEGLTNLRYLRLDDTKVTAEGVKKLQRVLPECKIEVRPSPF